MWGAATHDRATAVHRPLLATMCCLAPESADSSQALIVVALDHCILDNPDIHDMQQAVANAAKVQPTNVFIALSHTHAAGLMSRSRSHLPGGELIGPYLDGVTAKLAQLANAAASERRPATIVYGQDRCQLAANRDFYGVERGQYVCGFNPTGPADDTLLVAKIVGDDGRLVGSIVNYACHPTTLAWQNTLISPDFVGALRETVEQHTSAPCLFLQGASADLGPREGFVGDPTLADRNGRTLGFSALSAFERLPPPRTRFGYAGPVLSGATIGTWQHEPLDAHSEEQSACWKTVQWNEPLEYRADLPSLAKTQTDLEDWQREESLAVSRGGSQKARDCHARAEQAARQLWRLSALPPKTFPLPITLARLGGALWLFIAGEHYQVLQTSIRQRLPKTPVIVATITNGWQPGYIPPADLYGRGIYQESIAVVAAGSAENVIQAILDRTSSLEIRAK